MSAILRARSFALLPLMLVAVLVATLFSITPAADAADRRQHKISDGAAVVRHQKGDPYRYGAAGPGAFDCSGLIYYSFRKAGFSGVPRTSDAQARHMNRIAKRKNMRKGDFVFFHDGRATAGNVYHVGVFVGWEDRRRTIVHAPYGGQSVHRSKIWTGSWFPGTLRGL